ncbi:MAG: DUF433 domain-containing protein [Verrucomicrobia bacterium]|nr:DUF433 domain-containing protein [Verrucomicrobiota bacterium]
MKTATEHPYIAKTAEVCGGEPTIKGTRIAVRLVAQRWRWGQSPEEIREAYPHLTLAQVFDALSYAEDHPAEIEQLIQEDPNH